MGGSHGANRHEERLCPERLDDSLAAENPVRFIDACVAHLDLTTRGLQRATPAATGRPAYNPANLWKRSIDGSLDRLRSRRRLAQATPRNVEWRGLLKTRRPDPKTMADFRKHSLQPLRPVCRECPVLGKPLALCAGTLVAIDGSKGKAVNAQERHCTADKLKHLRQQSAQRVAASRKDRAGQENEEDAGPPGGAVVENVQAKLEVLRDDETVGGRGRLLDARAGAGAHGVALDGVGVQSPAGVAPHRDAAAAGRPWRRCAWAQGRCVGSLALKQSTGESYTRCREHTDIARLRV